MKPTTQKWINKAEGDWASAQREVVVTQSPNYDLVCFLAQQCAEKYLKARLIEAGLPFRKTHDLEELLQGILPIEPTWNVLLTDAQFLTSFAVDVRYPGIDATQADAQDAFACSQRIRQVIRLVFGFSGLSANDVVMNEDIFEITRDPIDKRALEQRLLTGAAGAVVTFDGTVRNHTKGRPVVELQYEAYPPMAVKEMRKVGDEMRARWPDIAGIGIVHRFGPLAVTESSIVIVVTSPHRKVAFEACHYAIDRVKQTVPIWKKEIFEDGEAWVEGQRPDGV